MTYDDIFEACGIGKASSGDTFTYDQLLDLAKWVNQASIEKGEQVNEMMKVAQDTKKVLVYLKDADAWYWHNRDEEAIVPDTAFSEFTGALADAVQPYMEDDQ